jgi:hypothetical protein
VGADTAAAPEPAVAADVPPGSDGGTQRLAQEAASHPTVQAVLDIFGGSVASVEPLAGGQEE